MTVGRPPVAIVGMAAVYPGAPDVATFWSNVLGGVDAIGPVPADRIDPVFFGPEPGADRFYCQRGGFVDAVRFDAGAHGIMPIAAAEAEPDQLVSLAVATQALDDAGWARGAVDPRRAGIVLGRGGYVNRGISRLTERVRTAHQLVTSLRELLPELDDARLAEVKEQFQAGLGPNHPEASIGLVPNLAASRVANRLDLHGPAYTVDAACASSLVAVSQAVDELATDRCELMLAGGVHHCHDVTLWSVFCQLGALSPTGTIRPFDRQADGILIGEGTGIVVLKRLDDAERDDDRIYAVIRGTGVASDGRSTTLMSPDSGGQSLAVERAWAEAAIDPVTVGLVEAHGTATPTGDAVELATLRRAFDPRGDAAAPVGLGSVKSMIGHAMPASGMASLIKTALAVHHGVLPPTLHCDEPHPDLDGTRFRPISRTEPWDSPDGPRRAGVDAFGFGGINAHVVLEAHPSSPAPASPSRRARRRRTEPVSGADQRPAASVFLAAADDIAGIDAALADDDAVLAGTDLADFTADGPVRLAIADPTPKRVALARKVVARGQPWRGRNGLWFATNGLIAGGGQIAYAFPGIEVDLGLDLSGVLDQFGIDLPRLADAEGTTRMGADMIWLGRVLDRALDQLGVTPDHTVGHSLGEWTAMIVSGAVPAAAVDEFIAGLADASINLPDLVFLAVGAGTEVAASVLEGLVDTTVSHDNCPHQAIICGPESQVTIAAERLKQRQVLSNVLPYRTGLHTPMFEPYLEPFVTHFADIHPTPPTVPVWSSVSAAPFPADLPADEPVFRELVWRFYLERVRFRELVENLYEAGVRVFVQPGFGSVTGFVDDTLRDREYLAIAGATAKRTGLEQLTTTAAALWVEGAPVRLDRLAPAGSVGPGTAAPRSAPAPTSTTGRAALPIRLGDPLVRGALRPLDLTPGAATRPSALPAADGPLAAEVQATLDSVAAASDEIITAYRDRVARPRATVPVPPPVTTPPSHVSSAEPPPTHERRPLLLSVDTVPALVDHAFFPQADGWPSVGDTFPLVPMTMMVELCLAAAERLAPGKVAVAATDIRALRWLEVVNPVEVVIDAELVGPARVKVTIEGYARATVELADGYPPAPDADTGPLADARPPVHDARTMYDRGYMFHGPQYQGVTELTEWGADGARARLIALPAPAALLDAAGQVFGHWMQLGADHDRIALPARIARLDLYGPVPEPGTGLDCLVRILDVRPTEVDGDVEVSRDGRVWARVSCWTDRRFESSGALFATTCDPQHELLAERRGGYWVVGEHWAAGATRDLAMRRYLAEVERTEYEAKNLRAQRSWLLGRIAVKDAVRDWLHQRGHRPRFPAEVQVANDEQGRPIVTVAGAPGPRVSLAHTTTLAVVAVAEGDEEVGIDLEAIEPRREHFVATTMTDHEQRLGEGRGVDGDEWATICWTAKEAVGKAKGTGLQGRPKDLVVQAVDGDVLLVDGRRVRTTREGEHVVSTVIGH